MAEHTYGEYNQESQAGQPPPGAQPEQTGGAQPPGEQPAAAQTGAEQPAPEPPQPAPQAAPAGYQYPYGTYPWGAYGQGYQQYAGGYQPPGGYQYPGGYAYPQGYQPPPPKRRSNTWIIVVVVIAVVFLLGLVGFGMLMSAAMSPFAGATPSAFGDQIGVVYVTGPIYGSGGGGLFGGFVGTETVAKQLERAETNSKIKAVIVRIDSPGGAAGTAQEIYQLIRDFREQTGKPVIASMGDVAASGGYYVAAAADKIVANRATMTGSIGVIMGGFDLAELMQKYGIRANDITSGKYKDTGSMFRHMRPDELQYLQGVVDSVYEQFVADVAAGRNMRVQDVKKLADGRIYTGEQAQKKGLVDVLGGLQTAVDEAKKAAGLKGRIPAVPLRPASPFESLFGPAYQSRQEARLQRELLRRLSGDPGQSLLQDPGPGAHLLECPVLAP
jgi:protease-4